MKKNMKVIQSIQRAINILNCFDQNNLVLSLNEISQKLDLNINTTRGLVNSLVVNNLIEHNLEDNTYSIGSYFVLKSNLIIKNNINRAKEISLYHLVDLTNKFKVSSRLQIITSDSIFTINAVNPKSHYILESTEQENFPLHATSSGKIFILYREKRLEELVLEKFTENTITNIEDLKKEIKEIEKNGYSTEFDEIGFGISSIAVPIFDNNNDIFGTISVTALTQVIKEKKSELILELKLKVKELEKELFYK
ncbi:IclR family transcriptional regulator [Fusobacterium necrophorum]|uniref:IclR family transcriptional regulator n=2 Tax=Fusobacterium necrophorum TaxID=859 RepID=A0AB73BZ04_9FUSO|nr:IclR family transcriptional regulator [Fusobacterium necrophorum]KDE61508.1 hypothetical protein FUSO4_11815 [Fusobacterium necrophorum DJ-1]KDE63055.1 hypothetical protein FUSO5_08680 [Fusobacterium necrophorum BFTR-1]KDE64546.1 hypothetical protein FUSO3_02635 [Fusobacterium necrophorum BL]KDE69018.1 hypothetical protein FUSO8_12535 [Fusobacterium necrophorum DJ-2]KDE69754.1 hypothetical protein FUSO6_05705 [Fusobacterium necrophorum DAB]